MSELFLIKDVYLTIFSFLPSIKDIIHLSILSSSHLKSIRNHSWQNKIFVPNDTMMQIIINSYNFKILTLSLNIAFNTNNINYLKHCHTLDLSYTKITDESVKELKHCHPKGTLDLSYCKNITDESVKELKHCHPKGTLHLTGTKITNEGVNLLRKAGCIIIK